MRLLCVHRLHYRKGGAEAVYLDHLALFREKGWACAEFAMAHPDNEPSEWSGYFPKNFDPPAGLNGLTSAPRFLYSGEAKEKFAKLLDDFQPDVIHSHGQYQQLTNSILGPARARKIPFVYTLHDFKPICPAYHFFNQRKGVCEDCRGGRQWNCLVNRCTGSIAKDAIFALDGLLQWRLGILRNGVDRFIGPSRFITEKFAEHGFDRNKLRYVPNFFESAADATPTSSEVAALKEKYGRYILYFGRLSAEKGVDILIDAAAQVGAPIVIVGDGPQRDELVTRARQLQASCFFVGHLSGATLWAHVEAARATVLPSVWYENAPKSVLEAQSRRKPVIATKIGGLPEMIEDGVSGFLVPPSDRAALAECLQRVAGTDDETLAKIGESARERAVTSFTRERYYREICKVYAEIAPALAQTASINFE